MVATPDKAYLCVCLNPVLQKTLVFPNLVQGEVNRAVDHRLDASGKGVNVARVLTETGRRALHLTHAGGPTREWFLALCEKDGLEVRAVDSGSEIRFCYTVVEESRRQSTELVEEALPVAPATTARLLEALDACLSEARAVIVSGTKASGYDAAVIPEICRRARALDLPLVLDIKGQDLLDSLVHGPWVAKPNLAEFLATFPMGAEADIRHHVARVAARLYAEHGTHLVLTRGSEATWFWSGSALEEVAVTPLKALNPTGSGDSFTAGLTASLCEGASLREAIAEGSRLGALNAQGLKPGSIRPTAEA